MSTPYFEPQAMLEFAAYLRERPDAASESAASLAQKFGLPVDIVEESLLAFGGAQPKPERKKGLDFREMKRRLGEFARARTVMLALAVGLLIALAVHFGPMLFPGRGFGAGIVVTLLTVTVCSYANYHRGELRYAIGTAFLVLAPLALQMTWSSFGPGADADSSFFERAVGVVNVYVVASIFLTFFTIPAALIGGYRRMVREQDQEARLDRVAVLQRIFDLKTQLVEGRQEAAVERRSALEGWRKRWLPVAVGAGLVTGLAEMVVRTTVGMPTPGESSDPMQILTAIVLMVLTIGSVLVCGFLAGGFGRGFLSGVAFYVVGLVSIGLLMPGGGWEEATENFRASPASYAFTLLYPVLAGVAGLGATVEKSAERKRRIAAADRAALLSEIVRLQQTLQTGAQEVTLMVVDVAGSTKMKLGANQDDIELSFGAFQSLVAQMVAKHDGAVFSTAGDGAITTFSDPQSGFACARGLLDALPEFNESQNRLGAPFTVRVGIHTGHVPGEMDKIAFSRVIDVAAHMEKVAPVGGIAVSGSAFEAMGRGEMRKSETQLDGEDVYVFEPGALR